MDIALINCALPISVDFMHLNPENTQSFSYSDFSKKKNFFVVGISEQTPNNEYTRGCHLTS